MQKPILIAVTALAAAVLACAPTQTNVPRNTPGPSTAATQAPAGAASVAPPGLQAEIDALPEGDAANGERIFMQQPCHVCHIDVSIAPPLEGLSARAASEKPGYTAEAYLYESIVDPAAYVVPGFQGDVMPPDFKATLTQQDLADLVAYLMTAQ